MYEKIEHCPICDHQQFTNYILCEDFMASKESFAITTCNNCSFLFTNPRPDIDNIGKYYSSKEYISHTDRAINPMQLVYKIIRSYTLKGKLSLINSLTKKGNLLDFGCGTGHFLNTCQQAGWNITGYEPDKKANSIAAVLTGKSIYQTINSIETTQTYDVITLWHVLEHIHDLDTTMKFLFTKIAAHGSVIIAVPNHNSWDTKHYKEYWAGYDVPRHLYHFTPETMKKLVEKHGFKINKTIPMKFDAYYVSILSEKNKYGTYNIFKSIINGFKSNKQAFINNNNYSSLLYILNK
ncbi:MAG: class I SAM-dependent methyltransferase [Cytophagales bacterium]|nr:class I SAM-dependent methyltransferase [Cytophagales bacterium]